MARKKSGGGGGGAPEWLVTFADLMSLLVCFFVLIISFSNQDEKKLMIVAGSMREAFGSQTEVRRAGLIEVDGLPINEFFRQSSLQSQPQDANTETERQEDRTKQGPEANTHTLETVDADMKAKHMMAAASLRQALQDMPDFAEISRNIVLHEDEEGLHIELVDQDGRAMFATGSRYPYPIARDAISRMAPVLRQMANQIRIVGHTSAGMTQPEGDVSLWELSSDRAESTRQILVENGLQADRIEEIIGKGAAEPLFVNDPNLSANRRVTITLIDEEPPLPPNALP